MPRKVDAPEPPEMRKCWCCDKPFPKEDDKYFCNSKCWVEYHKELLAYTEEKLCTESSPKGS